MLERSWYRFPFAIAVVAIAFSLRQIIVQGFGVELRPYITFFPAVMLVALVAGFWPGVVATGLGALARVYWIETAGGHFASSKTEDIVQLVLFSVMGVVLSLTAERYRRNHRRLALLEREELLRGSTAKLLQREKEFEALANCIPQLCWRADAEGHIYWFNQRWYDYTGLSAEESEPAAQESAFEPEKLPKVREHWRESIVTGTPFDMTFSLRGADGVFRPFLTRVMPLKDEQGKVITWFGTHTDVTEQKRIEMELREGKARLDRIVEIARLGEWEVDLKTGVGFRSSRHAEIYGSRPTDPQWNLSMILEHILPEHRADIGAKIKADSAGGSWDVEVQIRRLDGELRWIWARGSCLVDDTGEPVRMSGTVQDITDRKRAEEEMRALEEQFLQAQKMEAIGRLAGGIAHDFNNLLMVIRCYADLVHDRLPPEDISKKNIHQIMLASNRAAALTAQLLAFSRKQIVSPAIIDLNTVIEEALCMLRSMMGEDIHLTFCEASSLWAAKADPHQMIQILMNLCVNSRDALPVGGNVSIATENVTLDPDAGRRQIPNIPAGDYVRFSVADDGIGISKEIRERIFEPFFTTKEMGKGTGLGLSTVFGIVEQSRGYMSVESEPGKGTCFNIFLPRAPDGAVHGARVDSIRSEPGEETILVVEDESALREVMGAFLGSLGYKVLVAGSGEDALAVTANFDGTIDLLLTDVVMPKMGGRELSNLLGVVDPKLKVIYISGYTDDAVVRHGVSEEGLTFLQKPFRMDTLAHKVREALVFEAN